MEPSSQAAVPEGEEAIQGGGCRARAGGGGGGANGGVREAEEDCESVFV
jgi:hypothetical protein